MPYASTGAPACYVLVWIHSRRAQMVALFSVHAPNVIFGCLAAPALRLPHTLVALLESVSGARPCCCAVGLAGSLSTILFGSALDASSALLSMLALLLLSAQF
jgi:hypothetical protein